MATTTAVAHRVERGLGALHAELDDLPDLAAEWDGLDEANRVSITLDWHHLLADYLAELDRCYRGGEMGPDQRARYVDLLEKLKRSLPLLSRPGFLSVPVPLDVCVVPSKSEEVGPHASRHSWTWHLGGGSFGKRGRSQAAKMHAQPP